MIRLLSWGAIITLLIFTIRRWLFTFVALWPEKQAPGELTLSQFPTVLFLVSVRNEAKALPGLIRSLEQLDYPEQQLTVVFIDDGSTDESAALIQATIQDHNNWHLLVLTQNQGKAQALNQAVQTFTQGEFIAIYDADERPQPEALQMLMIPFQDEQIGGVSGRRAVSNGLASPAASYTTFEGLVHQLVTLRAKDRLKLAPALLGANCAYRRLALAQVDGFQPGALLEDSDLTVKLARQGWCLRFQPDAISYHEVPETIVGYWRQHTRWARGFQDVAKAQSQPLLSDSRLSPLLRLELFLFAAGYLDRVALLAGVGLTLMTKRERRALISVIVLHLITPFSQILAALYLSGASPQMWQQMGWVPLFFGLDVAMATTSFWSALRNLPQRWEEREMRK